MIFPWGDHIQALRLLRFKWFELHNTLGYDYLNDDLANETDKDLYWLFYHIETAQIALGDRAKNTN